MRNFRKYAHGSVVERDSFWHWVSVAQHYGLAHAPSGLDPTHPMLRFILLRPMSNVSMWTEPSGWSTTPRVHRELPGVLREALDEEGASIFTVEMLSERVASF